MSTPVKLPELGESVTEGTITRWLKQVGDTVEVDEPLLEVSTDKVDTEVPSPVAGKILEIKAEEDETVEVGAELCVVGEEDEETSDSGGAGGGESEETAEAEESSESGDESSSEAESPDESEDSGEAEEEDSQETSEKAATAEKGAEKGDSGGGGGGTPVKLPELGESVTEGTVTRWLKSVGDEVEVDEPLLEVSTDKVDTEVPSPIAGTLQKILVEEDETVEVGAELCIIGEGAPEESGEGGGTDTAEAEEEAEPEDKEEPAAEEQSTQEQQPAQTPEDQGAGDEGAEEPEPEKEPEPSSAPQQETEVQEERAEQQAPPEDEQPAQQESAAASGDGGGTYVTPLVRKMAAEHGVDLSTIKGTGVGGRIRKQDVLAAAEQQEKPAAEPSAAAAAEAEEPAAPSPLRGRTEPMTRLRKVIAKRMVESLQVSAQLTTVVEVDVTGISRLRDSVKQDFLAREGVKLSFMPFFAKATTDALKSHPALNAKIDTEKGEITYFDHENLAIAVDTEKGLLTPVIKEAGDLSVSGLARKIADLADRTRNNKIGPDDLSGGTFTLTNTGSRGALFDTPIINQPQVAILGTGAVVKRPVVIDDPNLGETIAVRHMCYLALTYDHRLVDGADAARFLSDVKQRLEAAQFDV